MYSFQVYVIMATLADRAIPCAYALLEHKRQETYVELLKGIEQCCTQLGVQPDPAVVVTDFESAAMTAVKQVFGSQVETHGCFFHLTQATWRRIQSEGLSNLYKTNVDVRLFCGMMDGSMAFLPVQEVKQGQCKLCRKFVLISATSSVNSLTFT